jgi:cytochrome c-type biogenesis protein CcmH
MKQLKMLFYGWSLIMALLIIAIPTFAQDSYVSDNEVLAIAEKMYCPVCENIPLDECQTTTCMEWKEEIRNQLAQGESSDEIITSFVTRFGDHVVGTPQDPILRALTIITPIIAILFAIAMGVYTFTRFGTHQKLKLEDEVSETLTDDSDEAYRQRLEQDLIARR